MHVLVLNGPPRSGKDELAKTIAKYDKTFAHLSLAKPIKQAMKAFFGLTDDQFRQVENNQKDVQMPIFFGRSWREVCIDFPEKLVKPEYGKEAFSVMCYNNYMNSEDRGKNIVISDCGFDIEVETLVKKFGAENVSVIRLQREDCSFDNDSRDYVNIDGLGCKEYFLTNEGTLNQYLQTGLNMVAAIKNGKEPVENKEFKIKTAKKSPKKAKKE